MLPSTLSRGDLLLALLWQVRLLGALGALLARFRRMALLVACGDGRILRRLRRSSTTTLVFGRRGGTLVSSSTCLNNHNLAFSKSAFI